MLKVDSKNDISKTSMTEEFKAQERHQGHRCSGVFFVNFEHISHLFLVFLLMTFKSLLRQSKMKRQKTP